MPRTPMEQIARRIVPNNSPLLVPCHDARLVFACQACPASNCVLQSTAMPMQDAVFGFSCCCRGTAPSHRYKCTFDRGTCVQSSVVSYRRYHTCQCKPGYLGRHCAIPVCTGNCSFHGQCLDREVGRRAVSCSCSTSSLTPGCLMAPDQACVSQIPPCISPVPCPSGPMSHRFPTCAAT
jgi:hypothetical protein